MYRTNYRDETYAEIDNENNHLIGFATKTGDHWQLTLNRHFDTAEDAAICLRLLIHKA